MAWYATGSQARQPEPVGQRLTASLPVGPARLSAGLRSGPFFADVEGALHGFAWTGHDDFAGNNVDTIALEVPSDMLGAGPEIGVWATISLRRGDGMLELVRGVAGPEAVMAHLGRILRWPRPKSAMLAAGIQAVYVYERLGGWRRMVSLREPARRNALGGRHRPGPAS
jgi:hypothetical protein